MFIVNVEGAIRKNDKWLIIKRSQKEEHAGGLLSLVGGKVELEVSCSDVLEETLKREIFEEVGVTIYDNLDYVHSTSFITDQGKHVVDVVFLCGFQSGEEVPKSPDEVEEIVWLSSYEVATHPNAPVYLKESIARAAKMISTKMEVVKDWED
ncbi:NUDIX domain-containing protein [Gracilibacillus caseinilyticus]|uniref:NUDIX domain-containing protein n=1 Tax=Gracilibacillus caseinilyticus TaxID=2932256 RepID=A0ABY4EQZ3_9BACI|nr:NUDIX domain-containing protein [Gracilibacillus caseinilyticus]UOQ46851.1 NUDIX domain-containing protein [Gracilibacillus caseinilyticus]